MFLRDSYRWCRFILFFALVTVTYLYIVIVQYPSYKFIPSAYKFIPSANKSTPSKEVLGWEVGVVRDIRAFVLPDNDTTLPGQAEVCTRHSVICVLVISSPAHYYARDAIRTTWAADRPQYIALAFFLGLSLKSPIQRRIDEESKRYRDIVQEDFVDSYNNLTIKSVLMLKWFTKNCEQAKYLVKTDDDMFLNLAAISRLTSTLGYTSGILIGSLIQNATPILDSTDKWYSPRYMYSRSTYPDYLSGTAYLMSSDVASKIYSVALYTPLFHLEDIFITGICASTAGVKLINGWPLMRSKKIEVACHKDLLAVHGFTSEKLVSAWSSRHECSHRLPSETSSS